jgi:hypothetical protein
MRSLDASTLRRLSVESDTDPRSIKKILEGKEVRGSAGRRARQVLIRHGHLQPEPSTTSSEPPAAPEKG